MAPGGGGATHPGGCGRQKEHPRSCCDRMWGVSRHHAVFPSRPGGQPPKCAQSLQALSGAHAGWVFWLMVGIKEGAKTIRSTNANAAKDPMVVEQPAPVIVRPEVVLVP